MQFKGKNVSDFIYSKYDLEVIVRSTLSLDRSILGREMMARFFVFRANGFPHGSACANYIQQIANALRSRNHSVIVIGVGENRQEDYKEGKYIYENIEYFNNERQSFLENMLCYSKGFIENIISKYNITQIDYAICYSPDYFTLRHLSQILSPRHISVCRVEHFQSYQYNLGKLNPKFLVFSLGVKFLHKTIRNSIPISSYIEKMDRKAGCRTLLLPPLVDENKVSAASSNEVGTSINFIYAGLKQTDYEDDIALSLKAFDLLEDELLKKIKLHFTGITEAIFRERFAIDKNKYSRVLRQCSFHGWLDYGKLMALYSNMHYLVLARKDNEITRANFPSKIPELMAYGVVPVCTRAGDYTDVYLKDGVNSFVSSENDVESFSQCLHRACTIQESDFKTMCQQAKKMVGDCFDYRVWAVKLESFVLGL